MARWIRFERDDSVPVLINMDTGDEIRPATKEDWLGIRGPGNHEGYLVVCGNAVKGDIDSISLMLGAETYSG